MPGCDARSDSELLSATPADPDAFGVFYRRHVSAVLRLVTRRLGSAELAADVTAEAFAAALRGCRRFDPQLGSADAWLYGIVANQLGSAVRRGAAESRARRRLGMDPVDLDADEARWIESLAATRDGEIAMALLAQLPDEQRRLLEARVIAERDYTELADDLGIPEATVRKRVSRGLALLRVRFQQGQIVR